MFRNSASVGSDAEFGGDASDDDLGRAVSRRRGLAE
jgi:hypothetical protein